MLENKIVRGGFSRIMSISVGFVSLLCVDFDICLGKLRCAFASLTHLQSAAKSTHTAMVQL